MTYNYLRTSLRELIDCPCASDMTAKTAGLISMEETHLKELKKVWTRWFNLKVRCVFTTSRENNAKHHEDLDAGHNGTKNDFSLGLRFSL